jgi:hypothetical protein
VCIREAALFAGSAKNNTLHNLFHLQNSASETVISLVHLQNIAVRASIIDACVLHAYKSANQEWFPLFILLAACSVGWWLMAGAVLF